MELELLAPAGSYESMSAAFSAGADAVYLGGPRFGARAYADNLSEEQLLTAIDEAHLRVKKLYLTVNTLFKDAELPELYAYLRPLYEQGLDAVIVQDMGAVQLIREEFPEIDLHASTQMTVLGAEGAGLLKSLGATRVVTAREMSLSEIKRIHDQVDIEIESFVHGALCYCYSGQCLMSSMIGGRSGNRGRCAQPCRLPYTLYKGKEQISLRKENYLLSPKDICTLDIVPQLAEAGIYSFKIEGRMKRPEYTAGVVSIYRYYMDQYLDHGSENFRVREEDMQKLMDLYNRGGFSRSYYLQHNGPDMMSMQQPNHWGTVAASAAEKKQEQKNRKNRKNTGKSGNKEAGGAPVFLAAQELNPSDVLEFRGGAKPTTITMKTHVKKGETFRLSAFSLPKNAVLYRMRNQKLLDELKAEFIDTPWKIPVCGFFELQPGQPAKLTVSRGESTVVVFGETPLPAEKKPLTEETLRKQLSKTGGTHYQFTSLEIALEGELFLPLQSLNELRRNALAALETELLKEERRVCQSQQYCADVQEKGSVREKSQTSEYGTEIAVSLEDRKYFDLVCSCADIARIDLDASAFTSKKEFLEQTEALVESAHESGKQCWYILPWIWRDHAAAYYAEETVQRALLCYDGIRIRNLEEFLFLKKIGYEGRIMTEHNLYTWNRRAADFWKKQGIDRMTAPLELREQEMAVRGMEGSEMIVYGYLPLMVSAQCQKKNTVGCNHRPEELTLVDRRNKQFTVRTHCDFCYNIISNSAPLMLHDEAQRVQNLHPESVRLIFSKETEREVRELLDLYIRAYHRGEAVTAAAGEFTRGHFKRGVE